jgi:hypothetical protein
MSVRAADQDDQGKLAAVFSTHFANPALPDSVGAYSGGKIIGGLQGLSFKDGTVTIDVKFINDPLKITPLEVVSQSPAGDVVYSVPPADELIYKGSIEISAQDLAAAGYDVAANPQPRPNEAYSFAAVFTERATGRAVSGHDVFHAVKKAFLLQNAQLSAAAAARLSAEIHQKAQDESDRLHSDFRLTN